MATLNFDLFSRAPAAIEERTYASVTSVSQDNIATVQKTIECWQKTASLIRKELESNLKADPTSTETHHDFKLLDDCQSILEGVATQANEFLKNFPQTKILLAVDSLGEIQAIACCGMDFEEELLLGELVTAPSNIRWKSKLNCLSSPIYGGGTLLMHALFKVAQITKKPKIGLVSTETGKLFYKKLGMKQDNTSFEFIFSEKSHHQNIERALAKAFGPSFKYSLLS